MNILIKKHENAFSGIRKNTNSKFYDTPTGHLC